MRGKRLISSADTADGLSSRRPRARHGKRTKSLWTQATSLVLASLLAITTFGSWGALLSPDATEALAQEALPAAEEDESATGPLSLEGEAP
ncbi:MAG: hypothetical protein LBL86_05195, partial [Coriobacteriales bacterium]|nr:hypothetical protein [Coriobacteriales bacterium]